MLSKTQPASFRGVPFLVDVSGTEGGRKTVTHEYPNTGKRFVEDLGDLQETFTLNGIVSGIDYMQKRDALIVALKQPDRGELVHPLFGIVTVVAKPYNLSESFAEFGIAKFTMIFEKADESTFPTASTDNTSLINLMSESLNDLLGDDIANIFKVTKKYPANFINAKNILTGVSNALGINADNILKITTEISSFSSSLIAFTRNINNNINNPQNLAADFNALFGNFSLIGKNAVDQFGLLAKLFKYGSPQSTVPLTTVPRVERERNLEIINSAVNINVLSNAYNTVPLLIFTTENDIKFIQSQLDDQFDYIMNNNNVSDDTIQAIKDLRVQVTKFLEVQLVNTFKISTIQTSVIPMTILCFQYYGNVDNTNALIDLNNTIDSSFVEGEVKILTQ